MTAMAPAPRQAVNSATPGEVILAMNNSRAPLDNVKVRQAITYAINKQDVNEIAEQGTATELDR